MTKEQYFLTDWKINLETRTIDGDGQEHYHSDKPMLYDDCMFAEWEHSKKLGIKYKENQVADWWRESLQTNQQYLELIKNQTNDNDKI
jgi:hypothetical protein